MPEPYPFQKTLVDKLGDPDIKGRLIGDEPGLGKTFEALWIHKKLLAANNQKVRYPSLIIAPWSVHLAWARHIGQVFPNAKVVVIDRKQRVPFVLAATAGKADFFICHYQALRLKDMRPILRRQWFHVIADEIHHIKSEKSLQRIAVRQLRCTYKTGMSASMAEDKPQDIWSPLNWVAPELFPSMKNFRLQYCTVDEVEGRFIGYDADGEPMHLMYQTVTGFRESQLRQFHEKVAPFFLRRRKEDVGIELPDKTFTIIDVPLPPKQRKVYEDLRRKMLAWIGEHEDQKLSVPHALARLVRLQQAALATMVFVEEYATLSPGQRGMKPKVRLIEPSAKLDALTDWLSNRNEQVVVFSQSRSMIGLVADRLSREGLNVGLYIGGMPDKLRDDTIDSFQAGKLDVFASTVKSGGEGITLTAASTVVFLDRAWGPFKNKQAEDRVHRIGQKNAVEVVDFFAPNTVDERVRDTNISKWSQLKAILGDRDA